ncbi:MAG: hypothetical protein GC203_20335 [Phenylobacterium sp.]|uniref:hypothetical protein n=1 Tax=Phenylobacterium sp. TaxID=1871053 RepID=UPI0025D1F587|nr:hypothetical protein [Phenylobacterium sp.]MBI1200213.1 hypothetical protein [Phenylobacterium sp.]
MSKSTNNLRIAATLAGIAIGVAACGKADVATPEPGDGARGLVANEGGRQASAKPDQTPAYGQPGGAPSEVHSGPVAPTPDTDTRN